MAKANSDGVYTLDGVRFLIRKGDALPEGAEFEAADDVLSETPDATGKKPVKQAKTGPTETTEAQAAPDAPEQA